MEEKSKKDHRALLNQGEENELVSLSFLLLQSSQSTTGFGQGLLRWCWLQGLERLQSGKAEISGHSFTVEEPAEAETVCLLDYGGLATLICIGLRAASSDIFQSNQVHSHIEVPPPLHHFHIIGQTQEKPEASKKFFILMFLV